MAREMWISLQGLYNHYPDIFDDLTLPLKAELNNDKIEYIDNIQELDKNLLIDNMLLELAELPLLYSRPDYLRAMISVWCRLEKANWLALWETMLYKYNPIWNKDGIIREHRDISREGSGTSNKSGTSSRTGSGDNTGTITDVSSASQDVTVTETGTVQDISQKSGTESSSGISSTNKTTAHNVTGFDTNSYSPNTQEVENGSGTTSQEAESSERGENTRTLNTQNATTGTNSGQNQRTLNTRTGTIESGTMSETGSTSNNETVGEQYERLEQGNIGVTMTQDMIRQQREIVDFNIYKYITESFKRRFCIMVY